MGTLTDDQFQHGITIFDLYDVVRKYFTHILVMAIYLIRHGIHQVIDTDTFGKV
jgi:hypothetical protein